MSEVKRLNYVESVLQKDSDFEEDMNHRMKCDWM